MRPQIRNFLALNARTAVALFVSLTSVGLISRILGVEVYAELAVILSLVAIISILGNSIVDACLKRVLALGKSGEWVEVSSYLSAAVLLILALGLTLALVSVGIFMSLPDASLGPSTSFLLLFVGAAIMTLLSGVLQVAGFYSQNFLPQSIAQIGGRLAYLMLLASFLVASTLGIWGVPIALILSSVLTHVWLFANFRRVFPHIFFSVAGVSRKHFKELLSNIALMLLVYVGGYLSTTALIVLAGSMGVADDLRVALAVAIAAGSISSQILTSLASLAVPVIHKHVAAGRPREAMRVISRTNQSICAALLMGLVLTFTQGTELIGLWLGHVLNQESLLIVVFGILAFGSAVLSIQWCHYFMATGRIKQFGLFSIAEGLATALVALLCLQNATAITLQVALATSTFMIAAKLTILKRIAKKTVDVTGVSEPLGWWAPGLAVVVVLCIGLAEFPWEFAAPLSISVAGIAMIQIVRRMRDAE